MTALLGYLDLAIPVFLLSGDATDVWSSVSFTNFKCSMHPTGPMLAFQLNIPEIFSEALASPAYMVATPMPVYVR